MQIVIANSRGFRAGVKGAIRVVERALDDFGEPEPIVFKRPRELTRQTTLAAGACPAVVAPSVSMLATGAVA